MTVVLDETLLEGAVRLLAHHDVVLGGILERHGPPPLWGRQPGFETIVRIVLEQQVSLDSAASAFERLRGAAGAVEPGAVVLAGEERLRAAGLTRQKSRYIVGLAAEILAGRIDLASLEPMDDQAARARLMAVTGIGAWTADIYLVMALRRPDVWPAGDLALSAALRRAKELPELPGREAQLAITEAWRPWRAVAARLLWHAYLAGER